VLQPRAIAILLLAVPAAIASVFWEPAFWLVLGTMAFLCVAIWWDRTRAIRLPVQAEVDAPARVHQSDEITISVRVEQPAVIAWRLALPQGLSAPSLTDEEVTRTFVAERRGRFEFPPLAVRVRGPLGLWAAQRSVGSEAVVQVLPRVRLEGDAAPWLTKKLREPVGRIRPRHLGTSHEIAGLRRYVRGDSRRHVDWRATARRGQLITREYQLASQQDIVLLIDAGRPMASRFDHRSKLDHAMTNAIAMTRLSLRHQDRVRVVVFRRDIVRAVSIDPRRPDFPKAYQALYDVDESFEEPDYTMAATWVESRMTRRALVAIITSVVDVGAADDLRRCLKRLRRRHVPFLVNLEDPAIRTAVTNVTDEVSAVRQLVALELLDNQARLQQDLARQGVPSVRSDAAQLSLKTLQAFTEIRENRLV